MTAPSWGQVDRGRVWHLLTPNAAASWPADVPGLATWCGTEQPIACLTELQPPRGARPCLRCLIAVEQYSEEVLLARIAASSPRHELFREGVVEAVRARPVEDVDLLAHLDPSSDTPDTDDEGRAS